MVIKIYTLKMHQAQHSISWYPQYSNDHTPYPPDSTVLRHIREAGIGITSIRSPPNQIFRLQKVRRKLFSENLQTPQTWHQCLRAQSHPREQGCISTHRNRAGTQGQGTAPPWLRSPHFLLSQLTYETSVHSPLQQISSLQPQTCLFHCTGKESLLSYSVFYTTG